MLAVSSFDGLHVSQPSPLVSQPLSFLSNRLLLGLEEWDALYVKAFPCDHNIKCIMTDEQNGAKAVPT